MRKTQSQLKAFAQSMVNGGSMRESMLAGGYSESQANKGKRAINKRMLKAMAAEGYKLADLAKSFSLKDLGDIAVGRLVTNAMIGKDGGAMSAKILGSHKDLNLFVPESQTGIVVIGQAPVAITAELLKPPED